MSLSEAAFPQLSEELLEALPDGIVVTTLDGEIVAVNERLCTLSGFSRGLLVGQSIELLVPRRLRAEHVAQRTSYVAAGGGTRHMSTRPDIVLVRADLHELPVEIALATTGEGEHRFVVASVRDASARRRAELGREREYQFLAAMSDITSALFSSGDVDETLRAITQRARHLLAADVALLAVPAHDEEALSLRIADGQAADVYEGRTMPYSSVAGSVILEHEPILLADASEYREPDWPDDLGPTLLVPLHARGETLGSLIIANRRNGAMFVATDVTLMKAFAAHATIALLDSRNQVQERRMEVLEDRERVAMEMHDSVIKRISNVALTLHAAVSSELPESTADRLWDAIGELDTAIASIRDAVFPQSPSQEPT